MDGLLIVDKPSGPTSHDVVARVRRLCGERRVGHTGTLDPAASGVLVLVLGRATRLARFLSAGDKIYEAEIRLGVATDTCDAQGRPSGPAHSGPWPSRETVDRALDAFRGAFLQQPPAFSAKKIAGRRSYDLARRDTRAKAGQAPVAPVAPPAPRPVRVTAHAIELVGVEADRVALEIVCSAGFYVRSLAHDLGTRLGIGAHLAGLRRTRSGDFQIDQAIALDAAERDRARAEAAVIPLPDILPGLPVFRLTTDGVRRAINGCDLGQRDSVAGESLIPNPESLVRLFDPSGALVGIARASGRPGLLHPAVVLM